MLLTKKNYPGRWEGKECNVCGQTDTDIHLFSCPGYEDILSGTSYEEAEKVVLEGTDVQQITSIAEKLLLVNKRLEIIQEIFG